MTIRVSSLGTLLVKIVVVTAWMISAPITDPTSKNRPPASDVPPITTARIASSSKYNPALFASAAAMSPATINPASPAHRPLTE